MPLVKRSLAFALVSVIACAPASAGSQTDTSPKASSLLRSDGSPNIKPRGSHPHAARLGQTSATVVKPSIVGGTEAEEGIHPFQVGLIDKFYTDNYQAQFCGGTLVAERFVVTAAHCLNDIDDPINSIQVLVGTQKLDDGSGQRVDVDKVTIHPSYNRDTWDYDVAVLELAAPVTGVDFATLASTQPTTPGTMLRVTGWGTLSDLPKPVFPTDLQQVDVPFVPTVGRKCGSLEGVTSRMLCAGEAGIDSCFGDSGGPLTINRGVGYTELVGIVSWGRSCALQDFPGAYTNVAEGSINRFIRNVVANVPPTIEFQNAEYSVSEGARRVTLTLERTSASGTASVRFTTANGSAVAPSDFRAASGTITFRRGQSTASVAITIVNDRRRENSESFSVALSRPSAGWVLGGGGTATVMITDDD